MNADNRKEKLMSQLDEFIKTEILDSYNSGYADGECVGFDAGRLAGIEEGLASAAALIAGLRALLSAVDGGEIPAELAPAGVTFRPLRSSDASNPIIDEAIATAKEIEPAAGEYRGLIEETAAILEPAEEKPADLSSFKPLLRPLCDCDICGGFGTVPGELYGEPAAIPCICKAGMVVFSQSEPKDRDGLAPQVLDSIDQAARERIGGQAEPTSEEIEDLPEVREPAAVDPVEEFIETIQEAEHEAAGDLSAPGMAEALAADQAKIEALRGLVPAGEPEAICFRLNCKNHDASQANGCAVFEHVFECAHQLAGDAVVCANLGCSSFESGKPANCAAIADMIVTEGVRKPATSCKAFMPAPDLAGTGTFDPTAAAAAEVANDRGEWGSESAAERENWLCCASCNIADPDCASCNLIELEIEERRAAEKAALALHDQDQPAADLPKCGNGSCTATGRDAKDVCLRISIEGRPGKNCGSFVPVEDCKHEPAKRFNDEDGSLTCGVCEKILQPSRRAAAGGTSQPGEGVSQGAPELSPEEARLRELQKTCKHPKVFIAVVPGRGEVCQCCDLVLTPETLPLFDGGERREAPDALTYFAAGEEESREGDTFREEDHQGGEGAAPAKPCLHPLEFRQRNPDPATGGFIIKCGDCGEIVNRLDAERKSIPRDQWPENKEAGKIVTIADGAETRSVPFSAAEKKMIAAGFGLVCFVRPDKENIRLWVTTGDVWRLGGKYKKFVDGERALEEVLKDPKTVQVTESGNAATSKDEAKLRAVGFNFYRKERGSEGVSPKIKDGSKNWAMHSKYRSDAELEEAWHKLLTEDPFALEG